MRHPLLRSLVLVSALLQTSCASLNLTPEPHSMPAARAGLLPEYRIFYDTLQDYGDWTLIEPYGYVFRPRSTIANWQPYSQGFWVPTDHYGWVWLSSEPFGWATHHYGQWFQDSYQGWCWVPGVEWAPAWVDWQATDTYVGWAPLSPRGAPSASAYRYVPANKLGSTDLVQHAVPRSELGARVELAEPVMNEGESQGVRFNRGPSLEWVERRAGPLTRARIEDLVSSGRLGAPGSAPAPRSAPATPATDRDAVQRAAERTASEARAMIRSGGRVPAQVRLVRPVGPGARRDEAEKVSAPPRAGRPAVPAKRDTTR